MRFAVSGRNDCAVLRGQLGIEFRCLVKFAIRFFRLGQGKFGERCRFHHGSLADFRELVHSLFTIDVQQVRGDEISA